MEKSPAIAERDIDEERGMDKERGLDEERGEKQSNHFGIAAAIFSFIVLGMNDATYGALIPYLESYYKINYTIISITFLSPFVGYIISAILTNTIHIKYGQLGIAILSPLSKLLAYIIVSIHPPFPVLPILYIFTGFGAGLEDGAWNAWIGNMKNANEWMGLLHGAYGLGATISPLIATAMVTKAKQPWYRFYYVMIGMAVLEFIFCTSAFRRATGAAYRASNSTQTSMVGESTTENSTEKTTTKNSICEKSTIENSFTEKRITGGTTTTENIIEKTVNNENNTITALKHSTTWLTAIFLLASTGIEVGIGGWLVTFMLNIRHGNNFDSGMVVVGYWLGMTVGRVTLGFITGRLGEKRAVSGYLVLCMILELCFWLIPSFISSAIFVSFLGFFLGPLFPAAIIVATQQLPQELHVSAIGFAAASGSGGGAILPFIIGAIAQARGVEVLQPIILALIVLVLILWLILSKNFKK